ACLPRPAYIGCRHVDEGRPNANPDRSTVLSLHLLETGLVLTHPRRMGAAPIAVDLSPHRESGNRDDQESRYFHATRGVVDLLRLALCLDHPSRARARRPSTSNLPSTLSLFRRSMIVRC